MTDCVGKRLRYEKLGHQNFLHRPWLTEDTVEWYRTAAGNETVYLPLCESNNHR